MFDSRGNVWAGANFIVGFQNQDSLVGRQPFQVRPERPAASPMTTGFAGGGLQGIGFGMAVDAGDKFG